MSALKRVVGKRRLPRVVFCACGNVAVGRSLSSPACKRCMDIDKWLYKRRDQKKQSVFVDYEHVDEDPKYELSELVR